MLLRSDSLLALLLDMAIPRSLDLRSSDSLMTLVWVVVCSFVFCW